MNGDAGICVRSVGNAEVQHWKAFLSSDVADYHRWGRRHGNGLLKAMCIDLTGREPRKKKARTWPKGCSRGSLDLSPLQTTSCMSSPRHPLLLPAFLSALYTLLSNKDCKPCKPSYSPTALLTCVATQAQQNDEEGLNSSRFMIFIENNAFRFCEHHQCNW